MSRFGKAIRNKEFAITCELIPGRGHTSKSVDNIMHCVESLQGCPNIHAVSITDNAGGNPALCADVLGGEIVRSGVDVIVHFSTKDANRNLIESRAYALQRAGVHNLLVITGDYPISGFLGTAGPVFDIGSVTALHYLTAMNRGLEVQIGTKTQVLEGTDFLLGAVVSPFKWTEGPLYMRYFKLEKKIRAGAHYIISQLGYDARKFVELMQYTRTQLKSDIPLLGSVYVLSAGAARIMNSGEIPGCYVSDKLLEQIREEARASDKGKQARLERAARQVAIFKGLGYAGAHLEGLNLKFEDVQFLIGRVESIVLDMDRTASEMLTFLSTNEWNEES